MAIVNTCSFIEDAKRESIETIIDLLELKKQGKLKKVIVAGCLAQRYGKELSEEFKEIDAIVGVLPLDRETVPDQVSLTPSHYAYVKICESCFNSCSFCAIPGMKGKFISRTIESVVGEIKKLDERGVKEINIIGQDITAYGMDLYREKSLAKLLKAIIPVTKNIQWIRLLYAFPAHITDELIDVMANEEKICKYIDMPLQHISDNLLKSMNRNITTVQTKMLIQKLRNKIPNGSLRTTFIVGMPGETEDNFQEMMSFIKETHFEKAGVFVYSREEGTLAYDMPDQVAEVTKKKRLNILMREQQVISKEIQQKSLSKTFKVLIEEKQKEPVILTSRASSARKDLKDPSSPSSRAQDEPFGFIYLGRTEYDAPEVDGIVYVNSNRTLNPGDFVDVKITDTYEYDLAGEVV